MKKLLFILIILLPFNAFAVDAIYKVSSGEVTYIGDNAPIVDDTYKILAQGVTLQDGSNVRDGNGNYRVFGYAKIYDNGTVRNATQQELDTFASLNQDDNNEIAADKAKAHFQNNPNLRKILIAFAAILVDEINILRAEHSLPERSLSQLKTAIINRISKDD